MNRAIAIGLALLAAGCDGRKDAEAYDVVIERKVLVDELEEFRRAYLAVRTDKKVSEALSEIWRVHGCDDDKLNRSLQRKLGNPDILSPIMAALPHLKLRGPGTLDCLVRGDHFAGVGSFWITDGDKIRPLEVELDGSAESALERVLLQFASKQFFLGWHANYNEAWILTDFSQFDSLVRLPALEETLPERIRALAMKIDFTPRVSVSKGKALVSYVIFAPFGGFYRVFYEVDMSTGNATHLRDRSECLVEYRSPICY